MFLPAVRAFIKGRVQTLGGFQELGNRILQRLQFDGLDSIEADRVPLLNQVKTADSGVPSFALFESSLQIPSAARLRSR
jgi:hypothetical protein